MAINALQPLKFMSSIKDIGSYTTVAHKLHTNTTISCDGYILITWVCKLLWTSRRYSIASRRPPMTQFISDELREKWTERDGDWDVVYIYIWLQGLHRESLPLHQYWYSSAHDFSLSTYYLSFLLKKCFLSNNYSPH